MSRKIFCIFLQRECEGQDFPPYPGKLGEKIYKKISKQAWKKWIKEQTKIINEKKLNMTKEKDQKKIEKYMKLFLFKNII
ncbi:oxidative damage protection protein [Buchnera aphidicola]|uniref:Probable Fe(2+)-trafficking protein n=1 Tax=Buchnera aphidicola (Aphis aurantii) TaxID=1470492 RepID=A0AAU6W5I2_9GAMM